MGGSTSPSSSRAGFVALLLLPAALFSWIQFSGPYLGGVDPYYHIKVSQIYGEQGIIDSFPWTQFSIHRDHFGDKELLFHVGMIPFLRGNVIHGAKVYGVVLASACLGVFLLILRSQRVPWPLLWLLICVGCGPFFLYRLAVVRPQIGGVALALLSFYAVIQQRPGCCLWSVSPIR